MNFVKASIHFQKSSRALTVKVPSFILRGSLFVRIAVVIGFILFLVQVLSTSVYDGVLRHAFSSRQKLNKELSQIQSTVDYISSTSKDFFKAEKMLHAKLGLPLPDEASRKLSTGGHIEPNVQLLRKTSPVFERTAKMHEDVWRIFGQIQNNEESFNSLTKYIDQSRSVLRYIPSISPTNGRYASAFGPRIHPVTGEVGKMHQGIDISNDRWTPIYAPADGVVEISQLSSSFGNFVVLNHGNGFKTRYGHMQMSAVTPGEFVHRYQILGYMGNTGRSVGPHLHYEVWKNGVPVNPLPYILPNDYEVD